MREDKESEGEADGCQPPNPNSHITHQFTEATLAIALVTDAQRKPPRRVAIAAPALAALRRQRRRRAGPTGRCSTPASRSVRLPRAQVQLSLMALYLLPDASFCSFLRISSILTFAGSRPPTARGACARPGGDVAATAARPWVPRQPLHSPGSHRARRLMNHARSMRRPRQARAPPAAPPAGSGAPRARLRRRRMGIGGRGWAQVSEAAPGAPRLAERWRRMCWAG